MNKESYRFVQQWSLKFAQMVAQHPPAPGYKPHVLVEFHGFRNPETGAPVKITANHHALWNALLLTTDDLTQSPARTTITYGQMAELTSLSRTTCETLLRDLITIGMVLTRNRGNNSNETHLFYGGVQGAAPPYPRRVVLEHDVCFSPTNRSSFSNRNPDNFHPRTQDILQVLVDAFPDHPCLLDEALRDIQSTVLQDCLAVTARVISGSLNDAAHALHCLVTHIVKYRNSRTAHAFEELSTSLTLAGSLRTRIPFWIGRYLQDQFANVNEVSDFD